MSSSPQSASEREELIAALQRSRDRYLRCVSSVPESAADIRLNADSWSILQIAEHVAAAEHGMFRMMELAAPKTTPPEYEKDGRIAAIARNREIRRSAPPKSIPTGRWGTLAECAQAFDRSRTRTIEFVRSADALRSRQVQHPLAGEIDGHQLTLLMAGHPERHVLQIEEIKSSAAYKNAERG